MCCDPVIVYASGDPVCCGSVIPQLCYGDHVRCDPVIFDAFVLLTTVWTVDGILNFFLFCDCDSVDPHRCDGLLCRDPLIHFISLML